MKTYIILIITLFTFPFKISGEGNFQIISLEGKNVRISLESDYVNNLLHIKLDSGDQICVYGFIELIHPIRIHKNFLIINMKTRGGSGVAIQYLIIICVSNDKIFKSLHVISLDKYTNHLGNIEYKRKISSVEIKQKNGTFLLSFEEILFDMGKQNKSNYTLHFDHNFKIFYSKLMPLDGLFNINSDYGSIKKEVLFKKDNVFPVVEIANDYYFINGLWHIHDIGVPVTTRHLTIFSNQCE